MDAISISSMQIDKSAEKTVTRKIKTDKIQDFTGENILDERKIEKYKGYKKYAEWADKWLSFIWIGSLIALGAIAMIGDWLYGLESNVLIQPASYVLLIVAAVPVVLGVGSFIARRSSDITDEKVVYHELASAFQLYRQDSENLQPVLDRISNTIKYLNSRYFERLDLKRSEGVASYLKKLDDAEDIAYISEEFHDTFPRFMQELSTSVAPASESSFSQLAKDMDSAYTGETAMKHRLIKDIKRVVQFIFTGPELVVTLSFLVLVGSVHYMSVDIGTAVGVFGGMIGVYSIYQNRD